MAEKKPAEPPSLNVGGLVVLLLVVFLLVQFIDKSPLYKDFEENTKDGGFSITKLIPQGELELDKRVVTNRLADIRQDVAGSIIGQQFKATVGEIAEGPVERFGKVWWRVNFDEPPSGWIEETFISSNVGAVRALNFFPSLYGGYLKFWLILSVILFILLVVVRIKYAKLQRFLAKKKKVEQGVPNVKESKVVKVGGLNLPTAQPEPEVVKEELKQNNKWKHIQSLINSHNMNDWRQAVIEADIILDEMLSKMQYAGESIGEKLKNVEESDFITLNKAWEAHKIRNQIAHKGSEFTLTKQEASRVIGLYQKVFEEFYYI